jgi:hypothetical protein
MSATDREGLSKDIEILTLAASVLLKLASGWVLVPAEPVAWRTREAGTKYVGHWERMPVRLPDSEDDEAGFIVEYAYAAAPDAGGQTDG